MESHPEWNGQAKQKLLVKRYGDGILTRLPKWYAGMIKDWKPEKRLNGQPYSGKSGLLGLIVKFQKS